MVQRVVTAFVSVGLIGLLLAGAASAQQADCCRARLDVCRDDIVIARGDCWNSCYDARQAGRAGCNANPLPFCLLAVQVRFAICNQQCEVQWGHNLFACAVAFRECAAGRLCDNSPTPTRTVTRTATPAPAERVATPTATPPPPQ